MNIMLSFETSIFKTVRGVIRLAIQLFAKPVILSSCNFVGRPFVACFACSNVIFPIYNSKFSIASNAVDF